MKTTTNLVILGLYMLFIETAVSVIVFWALGSGLQLPIDNNELWIGACILVSTALISIHCMAIAIGHNPKKHSADKED